MIKLNCGSGVCPLPGWINIDLDPASGADVIANLGEHIPYADGSVDFIHSEDFLSCLPSMEMVQRFLSEARRVLKPGGVMRLLLPSLERLIEAYQQRPDWLIEHWNRAVGLPLQPETAGHLLNLAIRLNPGFMFDRATLQTLVNAAGFDLRQVGYNQSPHPELCGLDDRRPDSSISVYWECDPR